MELTDFEVDILHGLAPKPSSGYEALSAKQVHECNVELDAYVAKYFRPEDVNETQDAVDMARAIEAVADRKFIRVVHHGNTQASIPDNSGVQFIVLTTDDLEDLYDVVMAVVRAQPTH